MKSFQYFSGEMIKSLAPPRNYPMRRVDCTIARGCRGTLSTAAWRRSRSSRGCSGRQSLRYPRAEYHRHGGVKDNVQRRKKVDLAMCYTRPGASAPLFLSYPVLDSAPARPRGNNGRDNAVRNVRRNAKPRPVPEREDETGGGCRDRMGPDAGLRGRNPGLPPPRFPSG